MEYGRNTDCTPKRAVGCRARWQVLAWTLVVGGIGIGLVTPLAGATTPKAGTADDSILLLDTFEKDTDNWIGQGPHVHLGITNEAGKFKNGLSALAFNYRFDAVATNPGELPIDAIARPIPNGQLAKMRTLSFWTRSDVNAPLLVALTEKEGGRYVATVWLPKNQWVHVVLTPEDFGLTDGKDDPKDPDGKLDMDQVESISMFNLWEFVAVAAKQNPASVAFFPPQTGEHTLWLDDITASTAAPTFDAPEPTAPDKNGIWVDSLRRNLLTWIPLGNTEILVDKAAPTKSRAIKMDYTQEAGKISALIHDLHNVNLTSYDRLEFDVAATKAAKVLVTLEKRNGAKYNTLIDVAGGSVSSRKALYFSQFKLADDSPNDPDNKLTLDQLKNITILDISAFINPQKQDETLWIGPIRATKG